MIDKIGLFHPRSASGRESCTNGVVRMDPPSVLSFKCVGRGPAGHISKENPSNHFVRDNSNAAKIFRFLFNLIRIGVWQA